MSLTNYRIGGATWNKRLLKKNQKAGNVENQEEQERSVEDNKGISYIEEVVIDGARHPSYVRLDFSDNEKAILDESLIVAKKIR